MCILFTNKKERRGGEEAQRCGLQNRHFAGSNPARVSSYNVTDEKFFVQCPGDGMVDIKDLKSLAFNSVWVRVPPWAQNENWL